ncbi:hypothetical protein AAZX31_02G094200 [Glycine max]
MVHELHLVTSYCHLLFFPARMELYIYIYLGYKRYLTTTKLQHNHAPKGLTRVTKDICHKYQITRINQAEPFRITPCKTHLSREKYPLRVTTTNSIYKTKPKNTLQPASPK